MAKDVDKQASWTTAHEGKPTERGKPFNPTQDDLSDSPVEAEEADDAQSVPIGRPVSSHLYNRLKELARNEAPLTGGTGQEDTQED